MSSPVLVRSADCKGLNGGILRDEALNLLDGFYAAALGEQAWRPNLTALADFLGYSAASLELHNVRQGHLLHFETCRIDVADMPIYKRDFLHDNPRISRLKNASSPISHDHLFMTETEMDRDRFYADFLRPRELRYYLAAETAVFDGEIKGGLAFQRSGKVSGADEDGIRVLTAMQPHLTRAIRLYWHRLREVIDPGFLDRRLASFSLTEAERRLARALAQGERLAEYALRKSLSMNTIYTHYRRIKEKLECRDRSALATRLRDIARGGD
jgi:DNA-binding CsgD family transcriptional regulator